MIVFKDSDPGTSTSKPIDYGTYKVMIKKVKFIIVE